MGFQNLEMEFSKHPDPYSAISAGGSHTHVSYCSVNSAPVGTPAYKHCTHLIL